ncbi:L-proline glycine betaine binding ABC transporter protein ProX [Labilithrix luteola]|uniref:L-proline glycine betaine binding ABC transporter protein ProX n=1 Tax=Labilithrix luteola TaxID=1391654 RepID=A0A0K1Q2S7_9BACT|nr:glycine betaine ABC transporter substrate-binding protein [Labilithrix luteola]AKU99689.1 L-proline glycine betaine binding ABC transporter protein ProX [Labilithrix luteola]
MRRVALWLSVLSFVLTFTTWTRAAETRPVKIGSKRFVESYVLAEMAVQIARAEGIETTHELGLGGTAVVFRALEDGAIDAYPEYTGTLAETVAKGSRADLGSLRAALAPRGLLLSDPIGFEDKYAIAVRGEVAKKLGLTKLSDLAAHPELKIALSHEFAGRSDGWPGLEARYGLRPATPASVMDHALAYEAIARGNVDAVDVYTTDAKIVRYGLVVLDDDRHFFPPYDAVFVYRADLIKREPKFAAVFERMHGAVDVSTMQRLNARADLDGVPFARVAADELAKLGILGTPSSSSSRPSLWRGTYEVILRHGPRHLTLVAISLFFSTLIGVPLGILAFAKPRAGAAVLGITGIVQTIPSLALFCFFIPLVGIGETPALLALFLYGLLPIVRNTHAGLESIPDELREAAVALGLSPLERLRHVELPLASRTIVAGIKTSAVVAVGSATIAAFIGAGGFGEPISTGLSLNDIPTILEGAIPAAGLALVVQGVFALVEHVTVPRGLRETRVPSGS